MAVLSSMVEVTADKKASKVDASCHGSSEENDPV